MQFINIGFGNVVNVSKIAGIISPESAPVRRMVQIGRDKGTAIDATKGRKLKSVIVLDNGQLMLSALLPETIANRASSGLMKGEDDED